VGTAAPTTVVVIGSMVSIFIGRNTPIEHC